MREAIRKSALRRMKAKLILKFVFLLSLGISHAAYAKTLACHIVNTNSDDARFAASDIIEINIDDPSARFRNSKNSDNTFYYENQYYGLGIADKIVSLNENGYIVFSGIRAGFPYTIIFDQNTSQVQFTNILWGKVNYYLFDCVDMDRFRQ